MSEKRKKEKFEILVINTGLTGTPREGQVFLFVVRFLGTMFTLNSVTPWPVVASGAALKIRDPQRLGEIVTRRASSVKARDSREIRRTAARV